MHRPRMSDEYAEHVRRWHERSYELAQQEAGDGQVFEYLGRTITVPPDVQPITGMAHVLGQAVLNEVRPGDRVLDMGTGSGVNAILAAATAAHVLAVDGAFDLIVFDPPFRWFKPRSALEAATTDEDYGALRRFFAEVDDHLAPAGRIVLFFGTSGDLTYVHELSAGFARETLATASLERDGVEVDYFTYRLTRDATRAASPGGRRG